MISQVDSVVTDFLPEETGYEKTIYEAMNYSVRGGGKRLRPMLMREFFLLFGGRDEEVLEHFMAAIEMIHSYSLVHDDLPAIDNDDMRRGQPSTHKKFGEAMGVLAGDALLNAAYECIATAQAQIVKNKKLDDNERANMISRAALAFEKLSKCAGTDGMIGGQVVDVEMTGQDIDEDRLLYIYKNKTGALLSAAMSVGAILGGADEAEVIQVEKIGYDIGMAFQIQDDILDETSTEEKLGKPIHSDVEQGKSTYVAVYGLEKSKQAVSDYTKSALEKMDALIIPYDSDETKEFIKDIFSDMANRDH